MTKPSEQVKIEREKNRALKAKNKELEREIKRKDKALAETSALLVLQKSAEFFQGGRGKLTSEQTRNQLLDWVQQAKASGARYQLACEIVHLNQHPSKMETLLSQRDKRLDAHFSPSNKLTQQEKIK